MNPEIIKVTRVGKWRISTVKLPSVALTMGGLPFETMVFEGDLWMDHDCERHATREEAVQGHERMCSKWSGR